MEPRDDMDCDCRRDDENLCQFHTWVRNGDENRFNNTIMQLEDKLLHRDADVAELRSLLAATQLELTVLRGRLDTAECHLRDARQQNTRLLSKIQEFEAREY